MNVSDLILGIDGGGSKTVAWLARFDDPPDADGTLAVQSRPVSSDRLQAVGNPLKRVTTNQHGPEGSSCVGRGLAGGSNPQAVGWEAALANLDAAVEAAFADAGLPREQVAAACVGLAGGDRDSVRSRLTEWAQQRGLASRFLATHDALSVLAAGTPDCIGVALISGTGSFAFGQNANGQSARAGGWGWLFGDEGSGYWLALAGLRAAARAFDRRGPDTVLVARLPDALGSAEMPALHVGESLRDSQPVSKRPAHTDSLVDKIYPHAIDRRKLARLAEVVLAAAAEGDPVSVELVQCAAGELAEMVDAVTLRLEFDRAPFPLALSGGLLAGSEVLRSALIQSLKQRGRSISPVETVPDPVRGAVRLARGLCPSIDGRE